MVRIILGFSAGIALATLIMLGIEAAADQLYALPPNFMAMDRVDQGVVMDELPFGAKALIVTGWLIGALAGASLARVIARRAEPGWAVAALVALGGAMTVMMIPHPLWMRLAALGAPLLAGWLATRAPLEGLAFRWRGRAA